MNDRALYDALMALVSQLQRRDDLTETDKAVLKQAEEAMKEWRNEQRPTD